MADEGLELMIARAASTREPSVVEPISVKTGGVDPLGLRQTNFDLMDEILPSLNNVARHIRPFVVVAWAWRRAAVIADADGRAKVSRDAMLDFVDRIEVIYVWSQLLRDADADLPGRRVLKPLVEAETWQFGGKKWNDRRDIRRYSTALSAPVNYGPALRSLGWIAPHHKHADVMIATDAAKPALDALEKKLAPHLTHPAFSKFGAVTVTAKDAKIWGEAWAIEKPSAAERDVAAKLIFGDSAPVKRQHGGELMLAAVGHFNAPTPSKVRQAMSGAPSKFRISNALVSTSFAWRRMQERQLFRLAMEALLFWLIRKLVHGGAKHTRALVKAFRAGAGDGKDASARDWLEARKIGERGPVELMEALQAELSPYNPTGAASAIADALAYVVLKAGAEPGQERNDRLPIARAQRETRARWDGSVDQLLTHVIEGWVLAQHVYWSVGRGLADARVRGKSILRLKIVLEEGGWSLAPGAEYQNEPQPTPDRLETALNLARECRLIVDE